MKIGIISDTHDHIPNIKKSVQIFKEKEVDFVLHLGDYINPAAVNAFNGVKLIGVFGNNDGDKPRLIQAFGNIGGEIKGDFHEFEIDGLKFACYHGTERGLKNALVECGKYDVVVYGHTHECKNKVIGNTLALNPGTAHGFWNKATVLIFDTENKDTEIVNL
ncbi:MAG: metallophosphoesterase [Nitrospirae bacterium]|nr:metallophosphoesterase [Nitrospirota bacterium]